MLIKNFFPTSPNGLKLSQHVVDMYRKICGNFWVDTYIFRCRKVILNFVLLIRHASQHREKRPQKRFIKREKKRENSVQQAFAARPRNRYNISGTKLRTCRVIKFHICFSHVLLELYMKFYQNQNTFWISGINGLSKTR